MKVNVDEYCQPSKMTRNEKEKKKKKSIQLLLLKCLGYNTFVPMNMPLLTLHLVCCIFTCESE